MYLFRYANRCPVKHAVQHGPADALLVAIDPRYTGVVVFLRFYSYLLSIGSLQVRKRIIHWFFTARTTAHCARIDFQDLSTPHIINKIYRYALSGVLHACCVLDAWGTVIWLE